MQNCELQVAIAYFTAELTGKIDAFLRRAHRYGFAANIQTVSELFDKAARTSLRNYSPTTTA